MEIWFPFTSAELMSCLASARRNQEGGSMLQEAAQCHSCMGHRLIQNVLVIKVPVKHNM